MPALLRPIVVLLGGATLLTGILYPLTVTGIAQLAMPFAANGSLVEQDGRLVGSALIGQPFAADRYFWGRPSAISYDASASGGSNLGPTARALAERLQAEVARRKAAPNGGLPADAATASASGLDPHISPATALRQVGRVAAARGRSEAEIRTLVEEEIRAPALGLIGEPRVSVLALNLALDALPAR
jgi:K+-transporting ATPase ATPase C chain